MDPSAGKDGHMAGGFEEDDQGNPDDMTGGRPVRGDGRPDRGMRPVSLRHSGGHGAPDAAGSQGGTGYRHDEDANAGRPAASPDHARHPAQGAAPQRRYPGTPFDGRETGYGRAPARPSQYRNAAVPPAGPPQNGMGDGNRYNGGHPGAAGVNADGYATGRPPQSSGYAQGAPYPRQGGNVPMQGGAMPMVDTGRPVGNNYHPADGSAPAPAGPPLGGYGVPPQQQDGGDDDGGKGRSRAIIITVVSVLAVILIAVGIWFGVSHSHDGDAPAKETGSSQARKKDKGKEDQGDPAAGARLEKIMSTYGDKALVEPVQESFDRNGIQATVSQETHGTTISIIFTAKDDSAMETLDNEVKYMSDSKEAQKLVDELSDELGAPVTMRYISRFKSGKESKRAESKGKLGTTGKSASGGQSQGKAGSQPPDEDLGQEDDELEDPDAGDGEFSNGEVQAQPVQ